MMITYLRVIKNFEGAEVDSDSVAKTNFPGILTCNGLIFMGKEHTTKSTKIYAPRKFLRVQYLINFKELYLNGFSIGNIWENFKLHYLLRAWTHQSAFFLNISGIWRASGQFKNFALHYITEVI